MEFVEQLKSAVDIVKVVGEYVRLRRVGATGRYTGLCPFHQEKTPSFGVNQPRQFYKCFGCGAGGDVLKFVMEIEGMTFPEALNLLAERNGIPVPKRTDFSDAQSKQRGGLIEMHEIAARSFEENLTSPAGAEARAYLEKRGVSRELVAQFRIGFSESAGQALTRKLSAGFPPDLLEASGLVRRRQEGSGHYDAFRGRLMFPIQNESGKVIAFGGRAMRDEDQPKYLNSPETPIYRKTHVLYNLHRARDGMRQTNRVVLVEGYMDVIGVYSAGVREVVASCGTALTQQQVRAMKRHADTAIVNFDPDNAGVNAAERAIQILLDENLHVRILALEDGLDPDEYVKRFGAETYRAKLERAAGYFHWLADRARSKFDMSGAEGRMEALRFLLPSIQKIADKIERAAIAGDVAGYLGVEKGLVLDQFKKAATDRQGGVVATAKPTVPSVPELERILLRAVLSNNETRDQLFGRLTEDLTKDFTTREIFSVIRSTEGTFDQVQERLSEPSRDLLHRVLAADDSNVEEEVLLRDAEACLERLIANREKQQLDRLREEVRAAERDGRLREAMELMARMREFQKERRTKTKA